MKRLILALSFAVLTLLVADLWLWFGYKPYAEVENIPRDSGISGFYVENGKYYIDTNVIFKNNTQEEKRFAIVAESFGDYLLDAIKHPVLVAYDETGSNRVFTLGPNEEEVFNVVYVGDYDGNFMRIDRLDPHVIYAVVLD